MSEPTRSTLAHQDESDQPELDSSIEKKAADHSPLSDEESEAFTNPLQTPRTRSFLNIGTPTLRWRRRASNWLLHHRSWLALGIGAAIGAASGSYAFLKLSEKPVVEQKIVRPTPNVLLSIHDIAEYETADFHGAQTIDLTNADQPFFARVEVPRAQLLLLSGSVTAGVDFTLVESTDIKIDAATSAVTVTLPEPTVLREKLDPAKVYARNKRGDDSRMQSITLDAPTRELAQTELRNAAINSGLFDRARAGASRTVDTLLLGLGYKAVHIRWKK